jgi:hypothetical protein
MIRRSKLFDRDVQERDARLFLVIVEGAETEPAYFRALGDRGLIPKHRVKLVVYSPENHASSPEHLLALAERKTEEIALLRDDEVWLVLDVDLQSGSNRKRQLHQLDHSCRQRGWNVAISNPCFEVWYWLHLSEQLSAIDETCASVEVALRQTLGGYSKKTPPAACLEGATLALAIQRATSLDTDPRAPIPTSKGSRLYRLFERLAPSR